MRAQTAILVTLVVYKIVLISFGLIAQKRTRSGADFFLGGRRLGPVVAAISASASSSSAWTLLGVSGAAYAWGLSALWLFPACVGGFALNWFLLAPGLRKLSHQTGALTTTDVLAPTGSPLRRPVASVASIIIILSLVTYVASQFQGAGKMFHETFGLSMGSSILVGSAIVVLYTLLGGFWAVSLTDTLQGLMMALTAIVLPLAALIAVGGPFELAEGMLAVSVDGYASLFGVRGGIVAIGFVVGLLGIGLGYPGQPHVVNRFMALKDERSLTRARWIALGWAVVVYTGMLVLGWCGRVLYPALADKEVVFITATNQLFPPVFAGVVLAAVLSAIMSTADSQLLVVASAITHDLGWGGASPRQMVFRSRAVVALLSAAAVVTAVYGPREIFSFVLFAWAAMGCAFGPVLLVRVLHGPVSPTRTLVSISVGFLMSVAAYLLPYTKGGLMERVVPFALALAVVWPIRQREPPAPPK